jgi:hypothetical protein
MVFFCFLPHTECAVNKNVKQGQNLMLVVVAFGLYVCLLLTMCFLINFKALVLIGMFKNSKKSSFFQRTLSMRKIIFTAFSVIAKKTKWRICFNPQVTYPDGIAQ